MFVRVLPQFDQLLDQQVNQFHVALTARLGQTVACLPWEKLEVKQDNIYDIYIYIHIYIYIYVLFYICHITCYCICVYIHIYILLWTTSTDMEDPSIVDLFTRETHGFWYLSEFKKELIWETKCEVAVQFMTILRSWSTYQSILSVQWPYNKRYSEYMWICHPEWAEAEGKIVPLNDCVPYLFLFQKLCSSLTIVKGQNIPNSSHAFYSKSRVLDYWNHVFLTYQISTNSSTEPC